MVWLTLTLVDQNIEKLTNNDIIERIKEIHGNKYNLSKVSYLNRRTKIEVICPKHGSLFTSSEQLFRGQGCSPFTGCRFKCYSL